MIENRLYRKDIEQVARILLPWDELKNKSFLITGASGILEPAMLCFYISRYQ